MLREQVGNTPFLQQNIAENWEQILANSFPTDRGLRRKSRVSGTSYFDYRGFGPALRHGLLNLGARETWIDVGGGELFAQMEFFTSFRPDNEARVGAISIADPGTADFQNNRALLSERYPDRFFYLSGRRIEDIPPEELPRAAVVSDLFAAMSFTELIDQTLAAELNLLTPGGLLVARLQKAYIRDRENRKVGIKRYLSAVTGAELVFWGWSTVIMRRTEGEVQVPPLTLTEFLSYKHAPNPKALPEKFIFCERRYVLK